jgi:hypothetical protein
MPCCLAISRGLRQFELPADTRGKGEEGRREGEGEGGHAGRASRVSAGI